MRLWVLAGLLVVASSCLGGSSPGRTPSPAGPGSDEAAARDPNLRLLPFAEGLDQPVQMVDRGDGSFLIAEKGGLVRVWKDGTLASAPFLDLRTDVTRGSEQGLLGLALDPGYASNGRLYVDYTDRSGDTQVVRYTRLALDPDRADPLSAKTLLSVDQPYPNHNGGHVLFGPDGMLYVGLGDGGTGAGGAASENGQDKEVLLGKILRLDVQGDAYTIPADNPFAHGGGRGEIWAWGLRNPWRFSFDRSTGDLYIGDVGQSQVEEVDYAPHTSRGGENYGWDLFEGTRRYSTGEARDLVAPVVEYEHAGRHCSVVGGHVYRGDAWPGLAGVYVYGDYCSGTIWGLWFENGTWTSRMLLETRRHVSSFAQDATGQLYLLDIDGAILRLAGDDVP